MILVPIGGLKNFFFRSVAVNFAPETAAAVAGARAVAAVPGFCIAAAGFLTAGEGVVVVVAVGGPIEVVAAPTGFFATVAVFMVLVGVVVIGVVALELPADLGKPTTGVVALELPAGLGKPTTGAAAGTGTGIPVIGPATVGLAKLGVPLAGIVVAGIGTLL